MVIAVNVSDSVQVKLDSRLVFQELYVTRFTYQCRRVQAGFRVALNP